MNTSTALVVSALALVVGCAAVACSSTPSPGEPTAETEAAFTREVPGDLLTQHNDTYRTGQNLRERVLTPANVSPSTFGKLFDIAGIVGQVYAQPLYVPHIQTAYGVRDLLIVVTEENWIYAFDAQMEFAIDTPLWAARLGESLHEEDVTPLVLHNTRPHVGITSTPAVRQRGRTATMYLSSLQATYGGQGGGLLEAHWIAYALDVGSGKIMAQQRMDPVLRNRDGHPAPFHAQDYMQRSGVLLTGDGVVFGFSTNLAFDLVDDEHPAYHGFVIALAQRDLRLQGLFDTTYASTGAGVWQGGNGIAADRSGRIYLMTANEAHAEADPLVPSIYGDAVVELKQGPRDLVPMSTFRPSNADALAAIDGDLGSSGPLILPGVAQNVIGGGKPGVLYVMKPDSLGGYSASPDGGVDPGVEHVLQRIDLSAVAGVGAAPYGIVASPVYWSPGATLYLWPASGSLMKWDVDPVAGLLRTGTFDINRTRTAAAKGGMMSLSSNGRQDGILWVNVTGGGAGGSLDDETSSLLAAYDVTDIHHELWASDAVASDAVTGGARFSTPTVAGGRVYLGGYLTKPTEPGYGTPADSNGGITELPEGFLSVYGLRKVPLPPPGQGSDAGQQGSDATASDAPACGDPTPMTWTYLYDNYFRYSDATTPAVETPGHCALCHASDSTGSLVALAQHNWLITGSMGDSEPTAREAMYTSLQSPAAGLGGAPPLVTGPAASSSLLTTLLKWYGATGTGAMPADDSVHVRTECAKAAVASWLASGAPDD